MVKFKKDFLLGATTAAHQVEGNNLHSDNWAQEQMLHSSYPEPSGIACDHITIAMRRISSSWPRQA